MWLSLTTRRLLKGGLVILALACAAGVAFIAMLPEQPAKATTAVVTAILDQPAEYRRVVDVIFRSGDGLVGHQLLAANEVGCTVGEEVRAERVGVSLRLAPHACRKGAPLP